MHLKQLKNQKTHTGGKTFDEKLRKALIAAVTGNIIDFGTAKDKFNLNQLEDTYFEALKQGFSIDDSIHLLRMLETKGTQILYIGDNTGEIVFRQIINRTSNKKA